MFGWLKALLGGSDDRRSSHSPNLERENAATKNGSVGRDDLSTTKVVGPTTVTLPPSAPRQDIAALQAKFSKGPKKNRRHDKRGRGPQLPKYPNGINPGGRH